MATISVAEELRERCHGSGSLVHVLTPTLDHRDPAFTYLEDDCPGCPDCTPAGPPPEPAGSGTETSAIPF